MTGIQCKNFFYIQIKVRIFMRRHAAYELVTKHKFESSSLIFPTCDSFFNKSFDEVFTYKASLPDWQQVRIKYADPIWLESDSWFFSSPPTPVKRLIKVSSSKFPLFQFLAGFFSLGPPLWWSRNHEARSVQSVPCELPPGTFSKFPLFRIVYLGDWLSQGF